MLIHENMYTKVSRIFNLGITWRSHLYAPATLPQRKFLNSTHLVGDRVHFKIGNDVVAKKKITVPAGNQTPVF
jgi:hypothetical protein